MIYERLIMLTLITDSQCCKYVVNEAYNKHNYCNWIHQLEGN